MKNIKIIISVVVLFVVFATSCNKFLDVNHNPNATEDSRLDLVFPAAVEGSASVIGNSFMSLGAIWAQHWTSDINMPGYMGEDSYSVQSGDYSYDLRGWNSLYAGALMDYEWVKGRASETENWNYYLMATVMQCYTYQVMVDVWDQIPVTDALKKVPAKFETGQQVYDILIQRIDEALSKDFTASTNTKPENDDLVFGGDIEAWKAFANTLKLKIYIRQRFVRPSVTLAGIQKLYNDGVLFLDDDAAFKDFKDESGKGNYWYESNLRGSSGALKASNTFLKYIKSNNDPRLDFLFNAPTSGHKGIWQGDYRDKYTSYGTGEPKFSTPNIGPMDYTYFISKTESLFLQAEAQMILNASASEVEALYIAAVFANCSRYDIDEPNAQAVYANWGYAPFPVSGTKTEQFETLMMQKWVAMANGQGLEAFFEHNRTHIPKISEYSLGDTEWDESNYVPGEFTVSVEGAGILAGQFPKRLLFSATERSKNPDNIPTAEPLSSPVWWEIANPSVE